MEPTDSPLFGAIVNPAMLEAINESNVKSWARKQSGRQGEPTEANYPEAWGAGRVLARVRYGERLKAAEPIPREDRAALISGYEGLALKESIVLCLQDAIGKGELTPDEVDTQAVVAAITGFSIGLRHLFTDHWRS